MRLPLTVHVFDVGGGLRDGADAAEACRPDGPVRPAAQGDVRRVADVTSSARPCGHSWRACWTRALGSDRGRVSARGFLAVLGERMAGLPGEALKVGGASLRDRLGPVPQLLDEGRLPLLHRRHATAGRSLNKNYIHFRFAGGAADEARRRGESGSFSRSVLALDFRVQTRGDLLVARLDKYDARRSISRLTVTWSPDHVRRQLDMLMDSDASPEVFARAFLADEIGPRSLPRRHPSAAFCLGPGGSLAGRALSARRTPFPPSSDCRVRFITAKARSPRRPVRYAKRTLSPGLGSAPMSLPSSENASSAPAGARP